jgi:SAM-dependent methyltransferase
VTEWFEQWFGEEYLRLYPHRDEDDARQLTGLIADHTPLRERMLLDLACGPGRHAALFRGLGARVVGLDLSMPLLSTARHRHGTEPLALVRGDMRHLPFGAATFDIVVNLFTSFGYFSRDEQHAAVLSGAAATLRPGGMFVLDYLNADTVRRSLVPRDETKLENRQVVVDRTITPDGRFVIKEIHLVDDGRTFIERVRLFSPADLESMLEDAGLVIQAAFGGYGGQPLSTSSPRVVLFGERR